MDFKRKVTERNETELQRTLRGVREKHSKSIWLVGVIACMLGVAGVWFGTGVLTDPEVNEANVLDASPFVRKNVVVAEDSAQGFLDGNSQQNDTSGGTSLGRVDVGKIGNYDIRYYYMFPMYEATVAQINGDYDDDGVLNAKKSDGGLGPIGETHSGLPLTLEKMYDSDPTEFAYLKEFVDNPMSYLKRCNGNDRNNHKWPNKALTTGCVTYWDGSLKVRNAIMDVVWGNPERMKKYYDAYLGVNEDVYIEPAMNKLVEITGKSIDQIGIGTVGCLFAVYVRYGTKSSWTDGCTASMTEEELINQISANAYAKGSEKRFLCSRELAMRMNRGELDVYGYYSCDGSCGEKHAIMQGRSFGDLFGKDSSQ